MTANELRHKLAWMDYIYSQVPLPKGYPTFGKPDSVYETFPPEFREIDEFAFPVDGRGGGEYDPFEYARRKHGGAGRGTVLTSIQSLSDEDLMLCWAIYKM